MTRELVLLNHERTRAGGNSVGTADATLAGRKNEKGGQRASRSSRYVSCPLARDVRLDTAMIGVHVRDHFECRDDSTRSRSFGRTVENDTSIVVDSQVVVVLSENYPLVVLCVRADLGVRCVVREHVRDRYDGDPVGPSKRLGVLAIDVLVAEYPHVSDRC